MDTVSPTRSNVRSNTVWARRSLWVPCALLILKRQGSMPRFQRLKTKLRSPLLRAVTKRPSVLGQVLSLGSSKPRSTRAMPCASVVPFHST